MPAALRMPLLLGATLSMAGGVALAFLLIGAPLPTVGVLLVGAAGYLGWRLRQAWAAADAVPATRSAEPLEPVVENESTRSRRAIEPVHVVVRTDHSSDGYDHSSGRED